MIIVSLYRVSTTSFLASLSQKCRMCDTSREYILFRLYIKIYILIESSILIICSQLMRDFPAMPQRHPRTTCICIKCKTKKPPNFDRLKFENNKKDLNIDK
jgi:hypothetical protein